MLVLVTRPLPDAERTAAALAARGHAALPAPVSAIHPTGAALPAGTFDAVTATSHHAFPPPDGLDRRLPVFAVGARTAAAARAAGFRDVRVGRGDAGALADLLRLTLPRPARLLFLAGRHRKPLLETSVTAAGYRLDTLEVYAAEALPAWPAAAVEALRAGTVGAALHYSRRSVELALALADGAGLADAVLTLRHLCLSDDCAEPLRGRGAAAVAVAGRPEEDALLALLDAPPP